MRLVAIEHVTLDGVMQAPGRPDEDTRGGFEHGGWAVAPEVAADPDVGAAMGARMAESDALLLGRRTYEDLLRSWNAKCDRRHRRHVPPFLDVSGGHPARGAHQVPH